MSSAQKIDLGLTGYDELFMSDAGRAENRLPKIYDIPLTEIDDFPDHPFKVMLDEDMDQLVQSVKERGVITPITLRQKEDGRYSDYGVPYVDEACAVGLSANTVVYGHHMKNGTMFSSLVNYADKAYFDEHPVIRFDTIYGLGEYQVIAAFSFDTNNETFRYNEFADGNETQFNEYVAECMARRAYDTGFTAEYGDKLLTLSTCEYTHTNGRFVVVAKLITE